MEDKDLSILLRIEGGTADSGVLDIYDAANTMYGMARAVNLVSHAFSNDGKIKKRCDTASGAQAFVHSSIKGCFEEQVDLYFTPKVRNKIGKSVISNVFWDYLTWCWSASNGVIYEPQTPYVKKFMKKDREFIYEMADILESPMQYIHKAIRRNNDVNIFISRPRVGDVLKLSSETFNFVTTREESNKKEIIEGNVTRFNVLSDFGRLFSDNENRVVSFEMIKGTKLMKRLAIDSMKDKISDKDGKLQFKVTKVISGQGIVKRYLVHDIKII